MEAIFSSNWYRVAGLTPRLRSHGAIVSHVYRGKDWYVLQDQLSGKYHRLSSQAYFIVGLMNGKRTLDQVWQMSCVHLGDEMVTQDEVIGLLAKLHRADILHANIPPDIAELHFRASAEKQNKLVAALLSPMSVRFPLFDPEKLLELLQPISRLCFSLFGAVVWSGTLATALVFAGIHWQELTSNIADRLLASSNLLLLWVVYPLVKILHEFGHGCAVKRWQGEVHEMGIMLLVLMPIPYVDASSSLIFRSKWQRIMVSAAGIMVELFLAALAIIIWVNVEAGLVRAIAFNVAVIAGVSTLLFNGNPLLRFDGYYILVDVLEIPNLGSRSNSYLAYLANRYLLGIRTSSSPASTPGESFWLGIYGPLAFVYRILVSIRIALFVAVKFFVVGVILAFWSLFNMVVTPAYKLVRHLFTSRDIAKKKIRVMVLASLFFSIIIGGLGVVPAPYFTVVEGVIQAPECGVVHAGGDGFIVKMNVEDGQWVESGDILITCVNQEMDANIMEIEARLREYQARLQQSRVTDRIETKILQDEMVRIEGERDWLINRKDGLCVRSRSGGFFYQPSSVEMQGRFVRQGTLLGYVIDPEKMVIHGVISQDDVARIRNNSIDIMVRLAASLDKERIARLVLHVPAATKDLPSLALSLEGGGLIPLDPAARSRQQAFRSLFLFELVVPDTTLNRLNERVYIRFTHAPEPVVYRWYRNIRRLFLSRFST